MTPHTLPFDVISPQRHVLGESAIWCPVAQVLWWIDIRAPQLCRWNPSTGAHHTWPMPELIGAVVPAIDGTVVVALKDALHRLDPASGQLARLVTVETGRPHNRLNDAKCDANGRLWCGSMWDFGQGCSGGLYRITPQAQPHTQPQVARLRDDVTISNGIAFAPDGRTAYFVDTPTGRIDAAPFDADSGQPGPWRSFATDPAPGKPDGNAVDSDGCVWSARFGAGCLARFTPAGRLDRLVALPTTQPTSCAFGGAGLATLFVTTATQWMDAATQAAQPLAGAVLALDVGARGLPEPAYGATASTRQSTRGSA